MSDRDATQEFVALDTMVRHTGKRLTPELVQQIAAEFVEEFRRGPCAWAFQPSPAAADGSTK